MPERASRHTKGRVVVVSGTGTGIGKTHFSSALLKALSKQGLETAGLKPIETGISPDIASDAARLDEESTFHVKRRPYAFAAPLSPHLATREAGAPPIAIDVVVRFVAAARRHVDVAVVELPGGLFTPLTDQLVNADLARALAPDVIVLVAPDRLGVLHEVLATARAAATVPVRLDRVALIAPALPDPSTGRNQAELGRVLPGTPVIGVARHTLDALSREPGIQSMAADLAR